MSWFESTFSETDWIMSWIESIPGRNTVVVSWVDSFYEAQDPTRDLTWIKYCSNRRSRHAYGFGFEKVIWPQVTWPISYTRLAQSGIMSRLKILCLSWVVRWIASIPQETSWVMSWINSIPCKVTIATVKSLQNFQRWVDTIQTNLSRT